MEQKNWLHHCAQAPKPLDRLLGPSAGRGRAEQILPKRDGAWAENTPASQDPPKAASEGVTCQNLLLEAFLRPVRAFSQEDPNKSKLGVQKLGLQRFWGFFIGQDKSTRHEDWSCRGEARAFFEAAT